MELSSIEERKQLMELSSIGERDTNGTSEGYRGIPSAVSSPEQKQPGGVEVN